MSADYAQMVVERNRRLFADGITDGMEITLRLMLGEETHGGVPYRGEVPPALEEWARAALAKIEASR